MKKKKEYEWNWNVLNRNLFNNTNLFLVSIRQTTGIKP